MTQLKDRRRRQLVAAGAGALTIQPQFSFAARESPWTPRVISSTFAGINLEIAGGAAPEDKLIEAVAAMQPGHVRWPGGELANYWNWREERAKPPDYSPTWSGMGVSVAQLGRLCRRGTEAVVVLNMLTDELPSQLEMLAALGRSRIPVKHVELGNDFFLGHGSKAAYARKFPEPAIYAKTAEQWAAAIRNRFPALKLAAVGDWAPNARGRAWNKALVPRAKLFDAVSIHWYGNVVDRDNWSDFPHGVVVEAAERQRSDAEWLGRSSGIRRVVDAYEGSISQFLERALPAVPAGLPVWLTEFNKARLLSQLNCTWLHGVLVGAMFLDLLSSTRIEMATLYNFVGPSTYASVYRTADALKEIVGGPSDVPLYSHSSGGVAFTLIAEALCGAQQVRVRPRQDHCRAVLIDTPTGWRLLVVNLSSQYQDASGWMPAIPKRTLILSEAPLLRKAFTVLPKLSNNTSRSARTVLPPFSIGIFE